MGADVGEAQLEGGHANEREPRQTARESGYPDEDAVAYSRACSSVASLSCEARGQTYRFERAGF